MSLSAASAWAIRTRAKPCVSSVLWVMGGNYPGKRSLSLSVYMYFESFGNNAWAFGAAIAVMLGIVVLAVTWLQAMLQHRIDRRLH